MVDESRLWLRQFLYLLLVTALVQLLQSVAGIVLWTATSSPVLLAFGLDAFVGATRELVLARRLARYGTADVSPATEGILRRGVAAGYLLVGVTSFLVGALQLWRRQQPDPTLLGVGLAAMSMLLVPIIGSYMKSLAMELHSRELKAAAVFTFGNSYLSMVLLISLLVNAGMERGWGDAAGAIIMAPFILQKGIGMFLEHGAPEFAED